MMLAKNQEAGIIPMVPENMNRNTPRRARNAPGGVFPSFPEAGVREVPDRFSEKVRQTGIDLGPEDTREIEILEQFLGRHVQPNRICDVQCMLLWNEWVRTCQRGTFGFPKRIREKEFRSVVMEFFDTGVAWAGARGAVYAGIKFVP